MDDNHLKIKNYWKDGFLFPIDIFTPHEASKLREELEDIEDKYKTDPSLPMPINTYKRINSQCVMPLASKIALNTKILDVVEMPTMIEGKKNKRQVNGSQVYNEISKRIKKLIKRILK